MGNPSGFKVYPRELPPRRAPELRVLDWEEVYDQHAFADSRVMIQAGRCMDCGIPFCHNGCPLGNVVPEFNDRVYRGRWQEAAQMLLQTNPFPEFTGRVCPAPCEEACVLNIQQSPVTIKLVEKSIIERAFYEGWIKPHPPQHRSGKRVAIVGSGPAGLAAAAQLNRAGHSVVVFERADRVGGLLTYGIPEFKLEKRVVERRVQLMEAEGIVFLRNSDVGSTIPVDRLRRDFDAILLTGGSTQARDLNVPGRELDGVHLAMEYLSAQNRVNLGDSVPGQISAHDKHVVVLGGGDTGADCLGTALRQGARSVHQFELLPRPPEARTADMPWPLWPMILRSGSAHEEGGVRDWSVNTQSFSGESGVVKTLHGVRLNWSTDPQGRYAMQEIPDSEFSLPCDLCLLAMGFVSPEHAGPIEQLGLTCDARGNVSTDANFQTNVLGVFAAGDMRRGQSLVVWALAEGRQAARAIDQFLLSS